MDEPRKKSSPFPIPRATEQETAPRPLSPMRRMLPIGIAASLVLGGAVAGATIHAYVSSTEPTDGGCPGLHPHSHSSSTNGPPLDDSFPSVVKVSQNTFQKAVQAVRDFIAPAPPPMVAGKMVVAPPPEPPRPPPVPPPVAPIHPRRDIPVPGGI